MGPPNATWGDIIGQAKAQPDILRQPEVVRNIQNILQTNVSVCSSLGQPFVSQMSLIYNDTLNAYRYGALAPLIFLRTHYYLILPPHNRQHRLPIHTSNN